MPRRKVGIDMALMALIAKADKSTLTHAQQEDMVRQ